MKNRGASPSLSVYTPRAARNFGRPRRRPPVRWNSQQRLPSRFCHAPADVRSVLIKAPSTRYRGTAKSLISFRAVIFFREIGERREAGGTFIKCSIRGINNNRCPRAELPYLSFQQLLLLYCNSAFESVSVLYISMLRLRFQSGRFWEARKEASQQECTYARANRA